MNVTEPTTCIEAEPFALQVRDDAMAPEFWPGCVILIDPTGRATNGAFVFAEVGDQFLFRTLCCRGEKLFLEALNPTFGAVEITSLNVIKGVIVQRAGTRRRFHKRYGA